MTISGHERASLFFEGASRGRREIVTPEGVSLPIALADRGERLVAFMLDFLFWTCLTALAYLLVIPLLFGGATLGVAISAALFFAFLVRNFYFIHFELSWQGATPGKRLLGLRVIDRHGGPLPPAAVVARNLTREIETFIPLGLIVSIGSIYTGLELMERLALLVWVLLVSALPLFTRDRLRAGDIIAGTVVIAMPRRALLDDLVERSRRFSFTDIQLKAYGAFELQVLEELLRAPGGPARPALRRDVCDKIARRIQFGAAITDQDVDLFLRDFYTAERAYLEREQLFGRRHVDKDDGRAPAP